jgi:hypothetical protein
MQEARKQSYLPDAERLSILSATILLAYAMARFVNLPAPEKAIELFGMHLSLGINTNTIVPLVVAGLTATGAHQLLRDHPAIQKGPTFQHWFFPALTAWIIGIPLFQLPLSPLWWVGFALGGALLMLVLVAEYIVVDPEDSRFYPAAAGLTAVSFALFLTLAIALRYAGTYLLLNVLVLSLASGLVSLRVLHLRIHTQWSYSQAFVIALIIGQLAIGLYYWPLLPVSYGLALLGPAYSITSLAGNLAEGEPIRIAVVEPIVVLILVWGAAIWIH